MSRGFLPSSQRGARSEGCAEPLHGHAPAAEPMRGEKLCAATFHSAEGTLCKAMLENLSWIFPRAEIHRGLGGDRGRPQAAPYKAVLVAQDRGASVAFQREKKSFCLSADALYQLSAGTCWPPFLLQKPPSSSPRVS